MTLDPARPVASRAGCRLDLGPKEFALLECLLASPGLVLSAEVLLERARDEAADTFTSAVKHTMHRASGQDEGGGRPALSITRQAAQQRFTERAADPRDAALASRASAVARQIEAEAWPEVTADWDEVMRSKLSVEQLAETWKQIALGAGPLQTVGQSSVIRKGPFRVVDVPLVFAHGPMKARVVFNHDEKISGLFVLLPDAP